MAWCTKLRRKSLAGRAVRLERAVGRVSELTRDHIKKGSEAEYAYERNFASLALRGRVRSSHH
jgi:hypothetical protein